MISRVVTLGFGAGSSAHYFIPTIGFGPATQAVILEPFQVNATASHVAGPVAEQEHIAGSVAAGEHTAGAISGQEHTAGMTASMGHTAGAVAAQGACQ